MAKISVQPEWLSVKSAAVYSDFCEKTIRNAVKAGDLKSKRVGIKGERESHRIKREWVDAWIEGLPAGGFVGESPPVMAKEPDLSLAEQIAREVVRLLHSSEKGS